jgi:hypothetical protein
MLNNVQKHNICSKESIYTPIKTAKNISYSKRKVKQSIGN